MIKYGWAVARDSIDKKISLKYNKTKSWCFLLKTNPKTLESWFSKAWVRSLFWVKFGKLTDFTDLIISIYKTIINTRVCHAYG